MGGKTPGRIEPKIFLEEDICDVITCFKFGDDRFRGLASAEGHILPFPIDFDGRSYSTLTLPCERVIHIFRKIKSSTERGNRISPLPPNNRHTKWVDAVIQK